MRRHWTGARRGAGIVAVLVLLSASTGGPVPRARAASAPQAVREAPAVDASVAPSFAIGRAAVDGPIRAAVVDAATGATYITGDFTLIGRRTGNVATVQGPDAGDGALLPQSPEVVGTVWQILPDERADDPGLFILGTIEAVNGVAVPATDAGPAPMVRLHLAGSPQRWVLDTEWQIKYWFCFPHQAHMEFTSAVMAGQWIAVGTRWDGFSDTDSTGVVLVERTTGRTYRLGTSKVYPFCDTDQLPAIPMPSLARECPPDGGSCGGGIQAMAYDAPTKRLFVAYDTEFGKIVPGPAEWTEVMAYDLRPSGGRAWAVGLVPRPAAGRMVSSSITGMAISNGSLVLRGAMPMNYATDGAVSTLVLLDKKTGALQRHWGAAGELDARGSVVGPANACAEAIAPFADEKGYGVFAVAASGVLYAWGPSSLCRYTVPTAGTASFEPVGDVEVPTSETEPGRRLPVAWYRAAGGDFLVGANVAVDLGAGRLVERWDPRPAVDARIMKHGPLVAVSNGVVFLASGFQFLRGSPVPGLARLDSALTWDPAFTPPFASGAGRAIALDGDRVLVGGDFIPHDGPSTDVAMLRLDGTLDPWRAPPQIGSVRAIAVDPLTGDFWIGSERSAEMHLAHFSSPSTGGLTLPAPALSREADAASSGCRPDGAWSAVTALTWAPEGVYVGGKFACVDGEPRVHLALVGLDGRLLPWRPDMASAAAERPEHLDSVDVLAIEVALDKVVITGDVGLISIADHGLLAFSRETGAYVGGMWSASWGLFYDLAIADGRLFAAVGEDGVVIHDLGTLEYNSAASRATFRYHWYPRRGDGIYALASVASSSGAAQAGGVTSAASASRKGVIIGGSFSRLGKRAAGSIARLTMPADTTGPTVAGFTAAPTVGQRLRGNEIPMTIRWRSEDGAGTGPARHRIEGSRGGRAVELLGRPIGARLRTTVRSGSANWVRARSTDVVGNTGPWSSRYSFVATTRQESSPILRFDGRWSQRSLVGASGGRVATTTSARATVTASATVRGIAIVAVRGPGRGHLDIWVDGGRRQRITLTAATETPAVVVWHRTWSRLGSHTVRMRNAPTVGHARFDLDGIVTLR